MRSIGNPSISIERIYYDCSNIKKGTFLKVYEYLG
jgi:hypothetical protein